MHRRVRHVSVPLAALLGVAVLSCSSDACRDMQGTPTALVCGGEGTVAPAAPAQPPSACTDLRVVMPNFYKLLDSGGLSGLRAVVASLANGPAGSPDLPPLSAVLNVAVQGLNVFADDPPEVDAQHRCLATPQEAADRAADGSCSGHGPNDVPGRCNLNRMCEVRRALDLALKNQAGAAILERLRPLIVKLLRYVEGKLPGETSDHYDDLGTALRAMAQSEGVCDPHDLYGLLDAVLSSLPPAQASAQLGAAYAILTDPSFKKFLHDFTTNAGDGSTAIGRDGFIFLVQFIGKTLAGQNPNDPGAVFGQLDSVLQKFVYPFLEQPANQQKYGTQLEDEIKQLSATAKTLLTGPAGPRIFAELQKVVGCIGDVDKQGVLAGALYDLIISQDVTGISLADVVKALKDFVDVDKQGTLNRMLVDVLQGIENDDRAVEALSALTLQILDDNLLRKTIPVLDTLVDQSVVLDLLTLLDDLLYGCKHPA